MPLDAEFMQTAYNHFNPYTGGSGTEHVGILLYSLARMTRPRKIVEFGSGHSTMYVLRALADNMLDVEEEKVALLEKSAALSDITMPADGQLDETLNEKINTWLESGHKACGINPEFFLNPYQPHLFSFESLSEEHEYVQKMRTAVDELGHSNIFSHLTAQKFSAEALRRDDDEVLMIDWAWNDDTNYAEFFDEFWPHLNPKGGLMIFHNPTAFPQNYEATQWLKKQRAESGENDVEVMMLEEPHKLNQNGVLILRKNCQYTPTHHMANPNKVYNDLISLVQSESS